MGQVPTPCSERHQNEKAQCPRPGGERRHQPATSIGHAPEKSRLHERPPGGQRAGGQSPNYEDGKGRLPGSEGNALGRGEDGRGGQGQRRGAGEGTMRLQGQVGP